MQARSPLAIQLHSMEPPLPKNVVGKSSSPTLKAIVAAVLLKKVRAMADYYVSLAKNKNRAHKCQLSSLGIGAMSAGLMLGYA